MKTNPSTTVLSMPSLKKLSILLCCGLLATQSAFAETEQVNPSVKGVGVVVKKNPGSGQRSVPATDAKGQTAVSITEAGDYTFTLARAEAQGGPVQGVKVGLGKNPSGRERPVSMVSNAKGEVTFKNLEVGNYTLLVVAPPAAPSAAQNAAEDKFSKTAKKVALCPHGVGAASCPKCKAIEDAKAGKTVTPPAAPAKLPPAPGKQDAKKADEAKMPQPDAQKESLGVPHVTLLK